MEDQRITPEFALMMAAIGMPIATALEVTTKAGDWDESKHPRADNGQFGEGGGGGAKAEKPFKGTHYDKYGEKRTMTVPGATMSDTSPAARGPDMSETPRDQAVSSNRLKKNPSLRSSKPSRVVRQTSYANSKPTTLKHGNKLYPAFNSAGKPTRVTIPEN